MNPGIVGLPRWCSGKQSTCQWRRCRFDAWVRKIPWRRKWQPVPVFPPGKSLGQRSLTVSSPWAGKELDTTLKLNNIIYCICQKQYIVKMPVDSIFLLMTIFSPHPNDSHFSSFMNITGCFLFVSFLISNHISISK